MTAIQLPLVARSLPLAFTERWRELGGPSIEGELLSEERGRCTFVVRIGPFKVVFVRRLDVAKCANELIAKVRQ